MLLRAGEEDLSALGLLVLASLLLLRLLVLVDPQVSLRLARCVEAAG